MFFFNTFAHIFLPFFTPTPPPARPLQDDLGWGDTSYHNANPQQLTPNFAALAAEGVLLDRHYVYHMCTPSRSSFLSGRLPVHVETALPNPENPNQGVPRNMTCIATKLKALGYQTHVVGSAFFSKNRRAPTPRASNPCTHPPALPCRVGPGHGHVGPHAAWCKFEAPPPLAI